MKAVRVREREVRPNPSKHKQRSVQGKGTIRATKLRPRLNLVAFQSRSVSARAFASDAASGLVSRFASESGTASVRAYEYDAEWVSR